MRTFLVILLLACSATGVMAERSQDDSFIGIFSDAEATNCNLVADAPYVQKQIYVIASLDDAFGGATAVEFKIGNYAILSTLGIVSPVWNSPLVIGAPATGIAVAWSTPQPPQLVLVGTIGLFITAADPASVVDEVLAVVETDPAQEGANPRPVTITSGQFLVYEVAAGSMTINSSNPGPCNPTTAIDEASWGEIKALY